jgi:hypothetical protein
VALLMGAEGVAVFLLAQVLGPGPAQAFGASNGNGGSAGRGGDEFAEVELADCRPSNKMSGRFITLHIRVSALVSSGDLERVEKLVRRKQARIDDGVNTIIRSAELVHLNEPKLETIRRRLKFEFGRIFGDEELVKEVLIPEWQQSRSGV